MVFLLVVMSDMMMVLYIMVMLWIATMMAAIVLAVMVTAMTGMSLFSCAFWHVLQELLVLLVRLLLVLLARLHLRQKKLALR